MCGICGVWYHETSRVVATETLQRMASAIRHRGPDEETFAVLKNLGLAFRRLSIIDVAGSHQPLTNERQTLWLVFNGEIYNFQELRRELAVKHQFRTMGDGEVIVHAYEEWGDQFVNRLRGMFAFALWDASRRRLVLAVDRLGKKPLYYLQSQGQLIFGSEPKAIFAHGGVPAELEPAALVAYLQRGYVLAPLTMYRGMRKLCPGELLVLAEGAAPRSIRYWSPLYPRARDAEKSPPEEWVARLRAELEEAVRIRMTSEVPLGAFLSGGLDSSAVVALMSQFSSRRIRTFSLGFANSGRSDESPYAAMVARRWNCEHTHEVLAPNVTELLPALARDLDEPLADSSVIPTFLVSQLARRELTVALSGDGGDEVFGGYQWYRQAYRQRRVEQWISAGLRPLAGRLASPARRIPRLRPYLDHWQAPLIEWCRDRGFFEPAALQASLSPDLQNSTVRVAEDPSASTTSEAPDDWLNALLAEDVAHYLPGDILVKVDRCSMLSSLEVRSPLLDHQLFEFMAGVPAHLKINGHTDKVLLRLAVQDLLPPAVIGRGKRGFDLPLDNWLRTALSDMVRQLLLGSDAVTGNWISRPETERMLLEHESGAARHHHRLWALMCLELWARQHLK